MKTLNRRQFNQLAALSPFAIPAADAWAKNTKKPNIILILADDMGYADPSCFGGAAVPTPNLDRIAQSGLKFINFYSASAVCSPTRASILTGRYPLRFGITQHLKDDEGHLPRGVFTLPKILKQNGYRTAHVGKWHLGGLHLKHIKNRQNSIPGPMQHGFDHYQCQNEEQPLRGKMGREKTLYRQGGACLIRDEKPVGQDDPYYDDHFTDINGREAVRLIEKFHKQDKPFFLNLWWLVPHTPYEPAPEPYWSQTAAEGITENQHRFRSMVAQMDAHVGHILDTLENLGIRENTLVMFVSDNGGAYEADIGPYKGGKTDLHEGGIRVPMMISWPGRIPAGKKTHTLGHTNDILPTLCAAAGIHIPQNTPLDGVNLWPHISKQKPVDRGLVFWQMDLYRHLQRHYPKPKPFSKEIVRDGQWKLLCFDGQPKELFNLKTDPLEKTNVMDKHPKKVEHLTQALHQFLNEPRMDPYKD